MAKRIALDEIKKKIKEVHGDIIEIDESTFVSYSKSAIFVDKEYGRWSCRVSHVILDKSVHPKRGTEKSRKTRTKSIEDAKTSLFKVYGKSIQIDESSYISSNKPCIFVDEKYGPWKSYLRTVLRGIGLHPDSERERCEKTCMEKYGVDNPSKIKEVQDKVSKSLNDSFSFVHWKTGEILYGRAGYEKAAVEYLNKNQINYEWQSKIFTTPILTPKGHYTTYRPDLYLIDENLWVEIKGYFRKDAEDKWNWFHKEYPNSELWNKKRLKELGIL